MRRYLRLYAYFLRFSFSKAMEFRVDFFFRVVMDAIFYATQIAFFSVLYMHTTELGGWDYPQILIFVAGFFMIDAIHMTVFANNMWMLPIFVNKGDLDYYLVRPVSSLFFLSLRDFAANSFLNLLIASGILGYALMAYPEPLTAARVLVFLLLLVNGVFLYYVMNIVFLIPVFWLHSARGLGEIFFALERYAERPERIFVGYLRRVLVTILPLSLVISRPVQVLFDGLDLATLFHFSLVTTLAFLFLVWFWGRALRSYSSASS